MIFIRTYTIRRAGGDELYHHGVKGQKHGVRRYQNEDGSLTPEGRLRYLDSPTGTNSVEIRRESDKGSGNVSAHGTAPVTAKASSAGNKAAIDPDTAERIRQEKNDSDNGWERGTTYATDLLRKAGYKHDASKGDFHEVVGGIVDDTIINLQRRHSDRSIHEYLMSEYDLDKDSASLLLSCSKKAFEKYPKKVEDVSYTRIIEDLTEKGPKYRMEEHHVG